MINNSLLELMRGLRDGSFTAVGLVSAAVERHAPELNAYKNWSPEMALRDAETADRLFKAGIDLGPIQGIPISVKDLFGVAGRPTYAGTARRLPEKWETEGTLLRSLRKQLGIVTGKTHTVEMAFGGLGPNDHWGTPRNPWDSVDHRVPGGSSSGAGVSLCEGSALLALGTDTAGSVRIPASMTGTVGLKTTAGRWPTDGIVPLSPTLDTPGLLARSVEDVAVGFAALDPSDVSVSRVLGEGRAMAVSRLRIGVIQDLVWDDCEEDVGASVRGALEELARKGARLIELPFPAARDSLELLQMGSVVSAECDEFVEAELPGWRERLGPLLRMRVDDGASISGREYLTRMRRLRDLGVRALRSFREAGVDVLATPTTPAVAPRLGDVTDLADYRRENMRALRNTCLANYLGLCGISLPVGLDRAGLPIGLQMLAQPSSERFLIAASLAVERVLGSPVQRIGRPPPQSNPP